MAAPGSSDALSIFYRGWEEHQHRLVQALAPLTAEQLDLHASDDLRSVGMLAAHIIGGRARWMSVYLGQGGDEIAALAELDRAPIRTLTAGELVQNLEITWNTLQEMLARWTPDEFVETLTIERRGKEHSLSRAWIIWHLIEHDIHHGGELSYSLGMHDLQGLDL